MAQIISAAGMRVIEQLIGHPPQTISELLPKVDVTRTAITEQLNELVEVGLVARELERSSGRGRPRFRYSLTSNAISILYPGNQRLAVSMLWSAIKKLGGDELLAQIINEACEILTEQHYGSQVTGKTPEERFLEIMVFTTPRGDEMKWQRNPDGSIDVWRRVCDVEAISSAECRLCEYHKACVETIVGEKIEILENRHEGAPYCVFRLVAKNPEEAEDSDAAAEMAAGTGAE